ncbi:MAG: hypothetical protein KC933_37565, partial [Myxococcales bacterium]|nr:hypothetical protein [Myxococcales bacterium]
TSWYERAMAKGVSSGPALTLIEGGRTSTETAGPAFTLRRVQPTPAERYVTCVPLVPLKVAAGAFGDTQVLDDDDREWVALDGRTRPAPGLFVAQVIGESMNRRIPNGAWCLWRLQPGEPEPGAVVLAQHDDIQDTDLGEYAVKVYAPEKVVDEAGEETLVRVVLKPDSRAPGFEPLVFEGGGLRIIAELVEVVG